MKIVIVGGVAGGANVAARARRLSEKCEIVVFEKGPYVSFANCGLPYFIGGEIQDRAKLLVHTPDSLASRFHLRVQVQHEVVSIDRARKCILVRNLETGNDFEETYDHLVLSTGSFPLKPSLPGIERPGLFTLRDIPDSDAILRWIHSHSVRRAVVVGAGFIGLEMVEQLRGLEIQVELIEAMDQVLPPLDKEMASFLLEELESHGVSVHLNSPVSAFEAGTTDEQCQASVVLTKNGLRLPADLILFGIGVRPETTLAKAAGLELGKFGGIVVDDCLRTSDPSIWALGDCAESTNVISQKPGLTPLAGPANRQGRIVADNILGRDSRYQGSLGTAVVRVFDLTAACTGANKRFLNQHGRVFKEVHLHPSSHASYYPGASPLALKLLFSPEDGTILGASAVGKEGVEKRIDVIATAILGGLTVEELAQVELCYAPPVGSAKDPVNLAGMAAENLLHELVQNIQWDDPLLQSSETFLLDVREDSEWNKGHLPEAHHIPLGSLRSKLGELPTEKTIVAYCQSGQRSYMACRILSENGFRCLNLSGAYKTWSTAQKAKIS